MAPEGRREEQEAGAEAIEEPEQMRIEWTIPALEGLDEILEFISARSMIAGSA